MINLENEILNIDDLVVGAVYACVWRDHTYKSKTKNLLYLTIHKIMKDAPSGEAVKTDSGNRCFSKLRWFGALPSVIGDIKNESI